MAITSELIGKLGGADVEQIPVEGSASGGNGSEVTLHTVTVPPGETWLVAVMGNTTGGYSRNNPYLVIGTTVVSSLPLAGVGSGAAIVTGTAPIKLRRTGAPLTDNFTGTVYTVKM